VAAIFLGMAYGLCLVSGLRQSEQLSNDHDRGAVVACYYVLAYLGFCAPYVVTGLNALAGQPASLAILAAAALLLGGSLTLYSMRARASDAAASSRRDAVASGRADSAEVG